MNKIAIVFSSKHGQTEKIARHVEDRLQERRFSTQLLNVNQKGALSSEVDGVILGGSVYAGKFSKKLIRWAKKNKAVLDSIPTALFTVSLNAADRRPEARKDDRRLVQELIAETGMTPRLKASFAGALKYRSYFWPMRLLMRRISRRAGGDTDMSQDFEYTNWALVDAFLDSFLAGKKGAVTLVDLTSKMGPERLRPLTREEWDQVVL